MNSQNPTDATNAHTEYLEEFLLGDVEKTPDWHTEYLEDLYGYND